MLKLAMLTVSLGFHRGNACFSFQETKVVMLEDLAGHFKLKTQVSSVTS